MARVYEKGEKIENYTVEGLKTIGDCAISYFALNQEGDLRFLKIYKSPTKRSAAVFQRFVDHQLFLKKKLDKITCAETILEVFELENAFHCQVKEFINGSDLSSYLSGSALTHDERIHTAYNIVNALMQIHEHGIVHADLKKEHIFIEEASGDVGSPNVRLIDFDFSRIPDLHEPVYCVASPDYASPEYLRGEKVDFGSDVFALGIILFELFCDEYPYAVSRGATEYVNLALNHDIKTKPIFINPLIGGELSEFLIRMLNPNKLERPDIKELHEVLIYKRNSLV